MATVADYIISRLKLQGVEAIFGVPAAYCAAIYEAAGRAARFRTVVTAGDLEAGYAADGYARVRGLSAVSVAYGVGTRSLVNAVTGAYVERSPVLVLNGGPSDERIRRQADKRILFSHSDGRAHGDLEMFRPVTCFCERAASEAAAPGLVDRAVAAALTFKRPAYVEIPTNFLSKAATPPVRPLAPAPPAGAAAASAKAIVAALRAARPPLLIVGVEVLRFGLADDVQAIVERLGVPFATDLLAKSVLDEGHPRFLGVFANSLSPGKVTSAIANADLIVSIGVQFGNGHAALIESKLPGMYRVWDGEVVRGASVAKASVGGVVAAMARLSLKGASVGSAADASPRETPLQDLPGSSGSSEGDVRVAGPAPVPAGLSYDDVVAEVSDSSFLDAGLRLISDTFLGSFPMANVRVFGRDGFMADPLWSSIGHSVGAAVGAAAPGERRPVVVCGDGGFQMVAQAMATMAANGLRVILVVVDNGLHGYEQWLIDRGYFADPTASPEPFAVLPRWDYVQFAQALGVGYATSASDRAGLRAALAAAKATPAGPSLVRAVVRSKSLPSLLPATGKLEGLSSATPRPVAEDGGR